MHPDLLKIARELDAADRETETLVAGLTEAEAAWRETPASWSVAECLDHLATANRVYLEAMRAAADRARADGRVRRGPARPGLIGRWFVRLLEPPVTTWMRGKAPVKITPRPSPPLADALARFRESQSEVRRFLGTYAEIDLARTRFVNPLVRGIRFSLATGLHVIPAHERRHLWQARNVREAATARSRP